MGLALTNFFEDEAYESKDTQIVVCNECLAHLCLLSLILSDQFRGLSGKAYLVDRLINIHKDPIDTETSMDTGIYLINKIKCLQCHTVLGWHYKKSFKYLEYYKEGKYVIELKYIRFVANQRSLAQLTEQAKILRRRRSSAGNNAASRERESLMESFRSYNSKINESGISVGTTKGKRPKLALKPNVAYTLSSGQIQTLDLVSNEYEESEDVL